MTDYIVAGTDLTAVADKIRSKGGTSAQLEFPTEFISAIEAISGGGGGSTNILSGTSAPTSSGGVDGDIYLQYADAPSGYKLLEYIQSSGTQYIDTGVPARVQLRAEIDCQWLSSGDQTVLGGSSNANTNAIYLGYNSSNGRTYVGYAGSWHDFNTGAVDQNRHLWEIDLKDAEQTIIVDGVQKATTSNTFTETTSTQTLHLFSRVGGSSPFTGKIFSVKIYDYLDGGALARYFIPVSRDLDDAIGMYDLVNDVFYANAGTGVFAAGSATTGGDLIATYAKVNGTWIDLLDANINDINTGGN